MPVPEPPPPADREARFNALFESTHRALLAYAVRRVTEPADAADVVAESFLVAWRRIDDVPDGTDARPWMFGVARRVLANARRGHHRRLALADRLRTHLTDVVDAPSGPGSDVEHALARLSDDDQELLRLVAWEELARDEIALVLGISRTAVRVRLHRARRRLADQLAQQASGAREDLKRSAAGGQVMGRWARAHHGIEEA